MRDKQEVLSLLPWQEEEQLETILYFLRAVHPHLNGGEGFRPCVELRPIIRGEYDYKLSQSLMLWDLEEASLTRLKEFLALHNGQPTCMFYSVFYYDNLSSAPAENGKKARSTRIKSETAIGTSEIVLDFDNISFDEYTELVDRFEELGIFALWVFSGHGYQAHILLDKPLEDKDILRKCVYKFRSKGFDCDTACIDPARLMRLPYTYNCKCFKDSAYESELEEPPMCKIMQESGTRYSLEDIFKKLDTLPTVSLEDELQCVEQKPSPEKKGSKKKAAAAVDADDDSFAVRKVEYPYLSNFDLPDAVSRMLAHTPHGMRNKVLGYLIRIFKSHYKLSKNQSLEILTIWAKEACEPAYPPKELKSDFTRLYYEYGGLGYDVALAKQFGPIDSNELIILRKKEIYISNKFFQDFDVLDGKVVRLYLAIKMLEHVDEPATVEKLSETLGISDRALRPALQDLIKSQHGYITKGNRRAGIPDTYHTHRGYSQQDGYHKFSYNDLKAYVTELYDKGARAHGELKLYLFMRWKFYSGDIFMSQMKMGENINVAQNTISDIVHRLQAKHFIKISKVQRYNCFESCEYYLLR